MIYLTLNSDGSGNVSSSLPIQTKHTSEGESVITQIYLNNSPARANVSPDLNPPPLIYTSIKLNVEGVSYILAQALISSISDTSVICDSIDGFNIGTILKVGLERMRVEEVLSGTSIRVTRNYTADGKSSTMSSHSIGAVLTADTSAVSLALPDPSDTTYNTAGTFLAAGASITTGIDPSILTLAVDNLDTSNIIKSNNALKYAVGSTIKIDSEEMKVVAVSGVDIQVLRGYNGTSRASHNQNAIIYLVGLVDLSPVTHKVFVKNDPPAGLPTQKKKDVKIVIVADEEPA